MYIVWCGKDLNVTYVGVVHYVLSSFKYMSWVMLSLCNYSYTEVFSRMEALTAREGVNFNSRYSEYGCCVLILHPDQAWVFGFGYKVTLN